MSSNTGLSRTRSLRQPPASRNQLPKQDGPAPNGRDADSSPSRLPQIKPLTRSGTTSTTSSSTTAPSASATARSRAGSSVAAPTTASGRTLAGIFSTRPTSTRRTSPTAPPDNAPPKPLGRAPSVRQAVNAPPPVATSTGLNSRRVPSTSARRPTSSGGLPSPTAPKTKVLGHSRAKSTATTLTAATTLRPPGSSATSGGSSTTSLASAPSPTSSISSRITARSHARTPSKNTNAAASSAPHAVAPVHRPAFNTNQQHYSPLKSHAAKPLTSSYLAPPSPSKLPSNIAISAETSRLQTELLQLSLLHREAGAITRQWHESAKRKIGKRFRDAAREHEALCAAERDGVEARNIAALLRWGGADGGAGLERRIQALDEVLEGVWGLSEPGGRYHRVVGGFQVWVDRMAEIIAMRKSGRADDLVRGNEVLFVSDLDARWKVECAGLVRKLEAWRRMLGEMGSAPKEEDGDEQQQPKSSIYRILDGCTSLVDDMLAELEIIQDIEKESRRTEDEWIERMNEELKIGDHEATDQEAPLWKLIK